MKLRSFKPYWIINKSVGLILPAIIYIFWEMATRFGLFPEQLLVPPKQVFLTFVELIKEGDLIGNLKISLIRVTSGFLLGTLAGFILGTAMGLSKNVERYIAPSFHSVRQVSLFAWMPLLMLLFGMGEAFKLVFIAIGSFYPVTLNTFEGIRVVPKEYIEVAKVFEYNKFKFLSRVILPSALPNILTGIRIGLGMSWMFVVGAEFIASTDGIGYMMTWGRLIFQFDVVMVGFFVIGTIGLIMNNAITPIETYFLRWQKTFKS